MLSSCVEAVNSVYVCVSCSGVSDSLRPQGLEPASLILVNKKLTTNFQEKITPTVLLPPVWGLGINA